MSNAGGDGDPDRDAILRRRSRLVALALSGITLGAAQACACLRPHMPAADAGADAATEATDAASDDSDDSGS